MLRAQQAAHLTAHGMSQDDIASVLTRDGYPITQPGVSKLLKFAKNLGCFEEIPRFIQKDISEDRMAQIRALLAPPALTDALHRVASVTGVQVRNVRVLTSGLRPNASGADVETALDKFGGIAAGRVEELIRQSDVFAATWGATIGCVIASLSQGRFQNDRAPIPFVPVCAEPFDTTHSSTRLVRSLNDKVNGGGGEVLSLAGVADFVARKYTASKAAAVREFIQDTASYARIFGTSNPLIDRVDSVLTSVGLEDQPLGEHYAGLLKAGEITASELRTLVVGDLGGVLFPRPGLDAAGRKKVDELNAMWTGIRLEHFKRIAVDAAASGKPGVIVVAIGRQKAEVLAEIIRRGLVNELIIDEDLAEALDLGDA